MPTDKAPVTETGAVFKKMLADREKVEESKFYYAEKYRYLKEHFDALLSRARQEAATAAYSEGRKAGLKEMDEAHIISEKAYQDFVRHGRCEPWASEGVKAQDVVKKLRQEYSSK